MRRKTSDSPLKPRTGSSQQNLNTQQDHRRVDIANQKRIPKLLSPKKPVPPTLNYTQGEVLPHIHRELSPSRSIYQKTDPGFEREISAPGQDPTKQNRVLTGLASRSKLRALKGDNKSTGVLPDKKEPQNTQIKKNSSWSKNQNTKENKKNASPQNLSPKRNEVHQSPFPFDEVSEAIHEKDEVDEDDQKSSPFSHSETEQSKEIHVSPRDLDGMNYLSFQVQENTPSQLIPESPRGTFESDGTGKKPKFRPTGISTGDMNVSGFLTTEGNLAKSPGQIRGAFMNEHISVSEFEKQKQKQKAMKEALDFQLNEKKRKQEEEKLKEREMNHREEERIKREMSQMKTKYEKETALESSKKMKTDTSENILTLTTQASSKLLSNKQKNKPEALTLENARTEPRETPNSNLLAKSATSSVKKVFDFQMSEEFETPDSKSNNGIEMLVDENKKLRDENSKKEELIDVLLNALKQKGRNSPRGPPSVVLSNGSKVDGNSYVKAKPQLEKIDVESDFYGYYLNQYKVKPEHRETSLATNEDKTYSINEYDNSEMKASKLKYKDKGGEMNSLDSFKVSTPQVSFYRPQVGLNIRNTEPSNLITNRVYSSPLTSHLNKYSVGLKSEGKGLPYMPTGTNMIPFSPNAMPLDAFKLPTPLNANGTKSNISIHKEFIHYNDNSIGRLKKRYEHSVDFGETKQQKIDFKQPLTTSRPVINILREDSSFNTLKNTQFQKKDGLLGQPFSSGTYGVYEAKTMKNSDPLQLSILDTAIARGSNLTPKQNILYSQGFLNANQLRLTGKINSMDTGYEKKMNEEQMRTWGYVEANPNKRPSKEELLEKMKQLPKLESKSKFPKDIFSLSMKKRACP